MSAHAKPISPRRVITAPRRTRPSPVAINLEPASAYEAMTRQKVDSLEEDLREIKSRVDTIFYLVIGSILLDMLTRWVG
jgi:hypothetical protein